MRFRSLLAVVFLVSCGTHTQRATVGAKAPAAAPLPVQPAARDYEVDTKRSRFEVWGKDVFSAEHRITFGAWRAHVTTGATITIAADVDMTTATVDLQGADGLLRRHLLEADRFPHATLHATMRSTGRLPDEVLVAGTTELHGVTRDISFTGLLRQSGDEYRLSARFVLDRQAFGIHYGPVEPFLHDDVRIVMDVVAVPVTSEGGSTAPPARPGDASRAPSAPR